MSNVRIINNIEKMQMRNDLPRLLTGDTIVVSYKIKDGNKFRIQKFEGVLIKSQGSNISQNITVRKTFTGVSVEKVFPIHSPNVESIEVLKHGKVRRARIYYLRKLTGKAAKIKTKL